MLCFDAMRTLGWMWKRAVAILKQGCPSTRPWTAAKSSGEPLAGYDPEISECDNTRRDYLPANW
jgi:hypothetical protein